jgi:hypothetical protein
LSNTGALGSWSACIACEEDTTRGMVVDYHDCCGSCELHEDCACCAGTRVGGAGVLPWCGGTGSWTPVCTQPIPRNYCCTPGAPVPPRT